LPIKTLVHRSSDQSDQSILIVAPHPDDETLGCGGAIALLRQLNLPVAVVVVSDGTKSHPNSVAYPPPKLKKLREQESLAALAILGVAPEAVTFLDLPDGEVEISSKSQPAIASIDQYVTQLIPSLVFLPWRKDPHPDHRASWQLFTLAAENLNNPPRIIEYPIWDWDTEQRGDFADSINAWRLDITNVLELKRQAIAQYRSQISDLINDDPAGFRLTPQMLQNFTQPWEIYLEVDAGFNV
jgi:LmbE family N-acetylglucosaminyl deacetylase